MLDVWEDDQALKDFLGIKTDQDLQAFLEAPSWGCLDMQAPPLDEDYQQLPSEEPVPDL